MDRTINKYTKMFFKVHCMLCLVASCCSHSLNFDFITSGDMERYFNVKTAAEVPEYAIVNPETYSTHSRRRRQIEWEQETKDITFTAFGEDFHLRLQENTKLLAKDLMLDIHNIDGIVRTPLTSRRCFYHGTLLSHNISSIAVSTCKGLMGMIALEKDNLYIRPLTENHAEQYKRKRRDIANPHIIYKRGADQEVTEEGNPHFCGLDPEYPYSYIYRTAMAEKLGELLEQVEADIPVDVIGRPPVPGVSNYGTDNIPGTSSAGRRKRQADDDSTKYLEIRVMVDRDMAEYYGDEVIPYTLTLMNVVAARYSEPSLGRTVIIHIVKLGVLTTDTYVENGITLEVSTDGRATLDSWTNYQWRTNQYFDDDPNHWDNAMFISRKDLMSGSSNSLLGIAWLGGTCYLPLQAGLSQDAGLSSGQIIAHEIGHTLGMAHDGGAGCPDKENVMSSSRPNGPGAFEWSACSKDYFDQFLASIWKTCLDDKPDTASEYPVDIEDRPGARVQYTPDEQCRRLWSGFTKSCTTDIEGICGNLFCERAIDGACYSNIPAADGTYCGKGKWCVSGECLPNNGEAPPAVNGAWTSWGPFSSCSRTCGSGVSTRQRFCTDPPPQNGGADCEGDDLEHILCNREDCDTAQVDFAHEQCAATNDEEWNGNFHTWTAYFTGLSGDDLCAFRCLASANFVVSRGSQFANGTRCSDDGTNDLLKCVRGKCIEFGCDGSTDATQRYDKCRVCGGDGSTCTQVTGTYSGGSQNVLTTFLEIPVGATSIEISNSQHRYSYMAVKPSASSNYIFGKPQTLASNEFVYEGTVLKYTSENNRELLYIDGPTTIPLTVQIYLFYDPEASELYRPKISYEYYVPSSNPPSNYWEASEGTCSVTCGKGLAVDVVQCISSTLGKPVPDNQCDGSERPSPILRNCNKPACPTGQWDVQSGECSVTCGTGLAVNRIVCIDSQSVEISEEQCDATTKPNSGSPKPCTKPACPSLWLPFGYGPCSATCGTGTKSRDVWCVRSNGGNLVRLDDTECTEEKPTDTEECTSPVICPVIGVWVILSSECSTTCGEGTMTRYISCRPSQDSNQILSDSQCPQPKPPGQVTCNERECIRGIWVISDFSECSVSCGGGIRTRKVECKSSGSLPAVLLPESECKEQKPHTREVCNMEVCPIGIWVPSPFTECSKTCGGGTKIRTVTCRDISNTETILPFTSCLGNRPATRETCNEQSCDDYTWFILNSYGPCSVSCGTGTQTQLIWCVNRSSASNFFQVRAELCSGIPPPEGATKPCTLVPCKEYEGEWFYSKYSECSATCGEGTRLRDVYCHSSTDSSPIDPSKCDPATKPIAKQSCTIRPCDDVQPDQGARCEGLFTREVNDVDRISSSTGGKFCKETIVAPTGQTIRLTFSRCNIRCNEENDQGYVHDGDNTYEFCCYDNAFSWTSSTNVVQVDHLTVDAGHGYEMTVEFLGQPLDDTSTCDRVYTSPNGQISSPNYPLNYPSNRLCKYYIIAPPGKKITLVFETFNLYSPVRQASEFCVDSSGDFVQVSDLDSLEKILYCGTSTNPSALRLPQIANRVLVQFRSDSNSLSNANNLPHGFRANYRFVDA